MGIFLPLLIENSFTYGRTMINASLISSAGMASLSAVQMVDTYIAMITTVFQGIASGAAILVAQYHGAQKEKQTKEAAASSISIVTLFGILLALLSVLLRNVIIHGFFGAAEPDVLAVAGVYFFWEALFLPLVAYYSAELGVLRGVGEGRTAMGITLFNAVSYLVFAFFTMSILKMGIRGLIISLALSKALTVFA